ncbi:MAG: VCBS repeat-containing protein [Gemmatimonadetes bacterium]|nr:VCBS repeat-containing protein [Gemmatimonadota bacterium]
MGWSAVALVAAGCGAGGGVDTPRPLAGPATLAGGDPLEREIVPFPVVDDEGRTHDHPFLGGFVVPRPQFVDIDGDADLDLFVQERTGELMFFENTGTPSAAAYTWRTDRFADLDVGEWSRFHDLDDDGDVDLLAEERFSYVRYFRNDGTATQPRFVLATDSLRDDQGRPIFSDRQNIPSIADVDCDGAVDLFLGRVDGTVARYEETALDDAGNPVFTLVDPRFEDIEIVAQLAMPGGAPTLHGANSMAFADADGDGDVDLFWGDYFEPGLLLIQNFGTCDRPDLRSTPEPLQADGELIATSGYNAPYPADIDGDGDLDLFVGVLGGAFNANRTASDNLHWFERTAEGTWSERTRRFLSQVDVGSESVPALVDLEGDGDLDLVVGSKLDAGALDSGRLHIYENVGGPRAPRFESRGRVRLADSYHYAPVFADLDADGTPEMLLGTWNDDVRLFASVPGPEAGWEPVLDGPLVELPRGSHSVPAAGDLDGDGDLDLLVGESSGEINFFRNVGSPTEPRFELVTEKLDDIDVGRRSTPVLLDLDGDGDLDLLSGSEEGGMRVFRNVGGATAARFEADGVLEAALPKYTALTTGDVDGDGDLDLVSGGLSGGVVFYRNQRVR